MNVTIHNTNSPSALCITEGCDYNYNGFLEILCMILNVVPHTDIIKMLSVNITQRQVNHLITGAVILCVCAVILCIRAVILCIRAVILCIRAVILCIRAAILCIREVILCIRAVILCIRWFEQV